MAEAVMVLAPYMGADQKVHRRDGLAPWDLADCSLKPLGMLVEHGIDHMDEGFVRAPDTMAACKHIAFDEAFHLMLR